MVQRVIASRSSLGASTNHKGALVMGHGGMEIANMALSFGQADIVKFKHAADRVSAKARAYMARTNQAIEAFATTSEVSATAFLFDTNGTK